MKSRKIGLIIVMLVILSIPTYFIYSRFCLDKYIMDGNTLTFNNSIYICKNSLSASDTENIVKTIGIGINGKRTINDYIWPIWVMEYKNDKEHNRIFIRGLMDLGSVYEKITK